MNNYIIRTRKFSKLKIPYLKITSLSTKKKNKKEKNIELGMSHNDLNYNLFNKINNKDKNNKNIYIDNKYEINEKTKLKSNVPNDITIISKKFYTPLNEKKVKIMKDDETNTDPITEIVNISPSITLNYNNNNFIEKKKESKKNENNKITSLKKNVKSSPNYTIALVNNFNNNNFNKEVLKNINNNNLIINEKKIFNSNLNNKNNIKKEDTIRQHMAIKGENLKYINNKEKNNKKIKTKNNFTNKPKIKKNNSINNMNFGESNNIIFNDKKKFNNIKKNFHDEINLNKNKNNYTKRNILTAISFSKSKDMEYKYNSHEYTFSLINKKYFYNNKKQIKRNKNEKLNERFNKKKINYNKLNEELNKNSLIISNNFDKNKIINKNKEMFSNKIYYLRQTNIKFNPCIYNLFNVPIIENNNSLEETIKQQTVSNFNNKYNFRFKTKNPKEKEKIKILFGLLQKHKNSELERSRDLKKYNSNSIKNEDKIKFDDNKSRNRPKSGYFNKLNICNYFSDKKFDKFMNKKVKNMISIKTINILEDNK